MLDLDTIRRAATLLEKRVRRTELINSHYFSERAGFPVWFKCENLQRTGSFKIRGASYFLMNQTPKALARGVITASAGNHAQGVACAAAQMKIAATVVMPESTPLAKVLATRGYGAEIILHGSIFDAAVEHARQLQVERKLLYVPTFDDPLIMAGQGTVGLEIAEQLSEIDTLLVPIGGGGLIAGIATAVKALQPQVKLIGVQTVGSPSALLARRKGQPVTIPSARSLADGISVQRLGEQTFPVIKTLVDDLLMVEEEAIARAIVSLLEKAKLVVEGAGAVTLAALLFGHKPLQAGKTVCVLSGGNLDVQTLARVVERGMLEEGRFLKVRIDLQDTPGALAELAGLLAQIGANILHVSHDRRTADVVLGRTEVRLELETRGPEHIHEILGSLEKASYGAELLH